ncbi:MAG TPA: hypothetical protein VFU02_24290 [Polyangiaceae bacterium]|nr:hypothetical protein [Polyangiaceae bacterium]
MRLRSHAKEHAAVHFVCAKIDPMPLGLVLSATFRSELRYL